MSLEPPDGPITEYPTPPTDTPPSATTDVLPSEYPSSYPHFDQSQLSKPTALLWDDLDGFPFQQLCQPSGDCAKACRDSARLYEGRQSDVLEFAGLRFSLFEVCSNLGYMFLYYQETAGELVLNVSDQDLLRISADIGGCLASTCETSRKPEECNTACSLNNIFGGSVGTHSSADTWRCLSSLCTNTCGMPYMNADVMGVGVLMSFGVQTALITMCALYVLGLAVHPSSLLQKTSKRLRSPKPKEQRPLAESTFVQSTQSFLIAQGFLGMVLQVAVLHSQPWRTDPLNGIAFLFVSNTAFLPPVFTLLLLHSQHSKSWLAYILTVVSWLLATVNFLILFSRFSSRSHIAEIAESALAGMNQIAACGGESAFGLCTSVAGQNPLLVAGKFYIYDGSEAFPNFKSMPFIWACSALMLIAVTVSQLCGSQRQSNTDVKGHLHAHAGFLSTHPARIYRWPTHWTVLLLAFLAFIFGTIYYQAGIIYQLDLMDVLEWHGWSFGQIAAVTLWVPVVVEFVYNALASRL